jgi:hypothetical protein
MELEAGLKLALDGRALLFVGSGFSRGATNITGNDFSLGSQLAAKLSKEAGQPEDLALDDAAELYVDRFDVDKLVDLVKSTFSAKAVKGYHKEIASVPWRRVYTTNYDDVFELACGEIGKRVDSVTPLDESSQIPKKNTVCVHLNGFVRTTTRDSVWNDLKLTQHSYESGSALDSDWGTLFRADLQAAQAIFFVGYSLYDLDVRRLLFEEQLVDKSFFVLGPKPDLATAHRAGKYGLLIAAGAEEFADQLANLRKTYAPQENTAPISFSIVPYEASVVPVSMEDRSVFDLLLFGRLKPELLSASFLGQVNYCGPRKTNELALARA